MRRKAVFLDIDGTLTEPGHNEPSRSALTAVEEARKAGHFIFLCSGRNYGMLSPLLKYEFDGVIASAGGYIECGKEVIFDCPMTEEQKDRAMEVLRESGVFRTAECLHDSYTDESFKEFLRDCAKKGTGSELLRWREQIEKSLNIRPMAEYRGQPVYKVVIMSPSLEQLSEPRKVLESDFVFCIQDGKIGGFINGEVVNRAFDKGKAVCRVCGYLHIPVYDSVAIGDSMNDREMIEAAGLGICMENGSGELKKMADDICPAVQRDGICHAFLKHHLIPE